MPVATVTAETMIAEPSGPLEFSHNVEQEIPYLRRLARRWHRGGADGDDLVQDTLLRALANAHLWQPGSNLRAWLSVIMRNQFFAGLAKSHRAAEVHTEYAHDKRELANECGDARLTLRDVARVLDRLPTRQRSAMIMVGVEGHSYEELARVTGATVGAIRCDLARARERLRTVVLADEFCSPIAGRARAKPIADRQYAPA
jgi:RNA polymerase sigma-70 factor (ECF subfamily)